MLVSDYASSREEAEAALRAEALPALEALNVSSNLLTAVDVPLVRLACRASVPVPSGDPCPLTRRPCQCNRFIGEREGTGGHKQGTHEH